MENKALEKGSGNCRKVEKESFSTILTFPLQPQQYALCSRNQAYGDFVNIEHKNGFNDKESTFCASFRTFPSAFSCQQAGLYQI